MSLGKFLKRMFQGLAKFFFGLPSEDQKILTGITNVVNKLKAILIDSAITDIITALTPNTKDDEYNAKFKAAILWVSENVITSKEILAIADPNERMAAWIKEIQKYTQDQKVLAWLNFGALLTKVLTSGAIPLGKAMGTQDFIYEKNLNLSADQHILDDDNDGIPNDQDDTFNKA